MAQKGVPKDVGDGVFRDKTGAVIPRRKFAEDPDFDVEPDPTTTYVLKVRAGFPRNREREKSLDHDRLLELAPNVFGDLRQS